MKKGKITSLSCKEFLLFLNLLVLFLLVNPNSAKADLTRDGGDLTYKTSATSNGGAGWKFSTVGWNYHLTTNNGMANVYVPLSELLEYLPMNI